MERVYQNLVLDGECWVWTGDNNGRYGRVRVNGQRWLAHRFVWTDMRGEIPPGLEIDHLCRNTFCVNPDHLEPVTHRENLRRSKYSWYGRTHCRRGHELTPENIYSHAGGRQCKPCLLAANRRSAAKSRA